jgi:DNA repair protein RadC
MNAPAHRIQLYEVRLRKAGTLRVAQPTCSGSYEALRLFGPLLRHVPHEEVWLACLDGCNRVLGLSRVSQGGLHGAALTPRDVLQPALVANASAIILAHNHPSGDPIPSQADITMTRALAGVCESLGIPLVDHIIVAREGCRSLFELGVISRPEESP